MAQDPPILPPNPNEPFVPPMRTTLAFVIEAVCKDRGLTRAAFDALSDTAQEEMVAHYLAEQQIAKWDNYRQAYALRQK